MWQNRDPASYQEWKTCSFLPQSVQYYTKQFVTNMTALNQHCNSTKHFNVFLVLNTDPVPHYSHCPHPVSGDNCTAMLLLNLAQPHWISVKCNESLVRSVYCQITKKPNFEMFRESPEVWQANMATCGVFSVKIKNLCYSFRWCFLQTARKHTQKRNFKIMDLEQLFDAVVGSFPPIVTANLSHSVSFHKCSKTKRCEYKLIDRDSKVFLVDINKERKEVVPGTLYKCSGGEYISALYVCDGKNDCADSGQDESGCECSSTKNGVNICKYYITPSGHKSCSVFYVKAPQNECHLFAFGAFSNIKGLGQRGDMAGDNLLLGRLTPEFYTLDISASEYKQNCGEKGQLSCNHPNPPCCNTSEICAFKLNKNGQLKICRTGQHVQNCTRFNCNMMFKCPDFYCIPWSYLCDNKWDCPGGIDESTKYLCGEQSKCSHLFKCRQYHTCVHFRNLCDGHRDCLLGDDEYFCSLQTSICPTLCACLLFSLKCYNATLTEKNHLFYNSVWLESIIFAHGKLVSLFPEAIVFSIVDSGMRDSCLLSLNMNKLIKLDVSVNRITVLKNKCFQHSCELKIMDLSRNQIICIEQEAFHNLSNLLSLNLTSNPIQSNDFLSGLIRIEMLSFEFKDIAYVSRDMLENTAVGFIQTDTYHLCCLLSLQVTACTAKFPWYISCSGLLTETTLQVMFSAVCSIIFILNLTSILCQQVSNQKGLEKIRAHGITVTSMNVADLVCTVPLCILWAADLNFSENIVFRETQWRSSNLCFAALGATL